MSCAETAQPVHLAHEAFFVATCSEVVGVKAWHCMVQYKVYGRVQFASLPYGIQDGTAGQQAIHDWTDNAATSCRGANQAYAMPKSTHAEGQMGHMPYANSAHAALLVASLSLFALNLEAVEPRQDDEANVC